MENMRNKCCSDPVGKRIPVGEDGYICQKCADETHKEVKFASKQKGVQE